LTYSYNAANQLIIAKLNSSPDTWYYEYDNNGNQVRQVPNGLAPAAGEVRYTFNQRNHLVRMETHDGSDYQLQGEAMYDGDGQRVQTVAYVMGIPLTTTYSLDRRSGNPLLVDSGGSQRAILYGLFALGEVGDSEWHYYLGDAQFSVRQLVNESGDLALTRNYDPFGLVLQETGSGEALFGFMGAQAGGMGLLYVGGRYYDPRTGRFLSPNHDNFDPKRPGTLNPYLSIIFLGPLLLLVGRRRLKGKKRHVTIWLLVGFSLTTVLTGCQESGSEATATPTAGEIQQAPAVTNTAEPTATAASTPTSTATLTATSTPTHTPTATCTPIPTATSTPTPTLSPVTITPIPGVSPSTIQKYQELLNDPAMAHEREPENGSLKDDVLIAIIIHVELKALPSDHDAFHEALEAASWQYHSDGFNLGTMCKGHCDSIEVELRWLQEMDAFRLTSSANTLSGWPLQRDFAREVQAYPPYQGPIGANSHVWGNYFDNTPMDNYIRSGGHTRREPAPWFNRVPFNVLYEPTRFVVMSGEQNLACRNIRCGGF
jgi:RHS repeat-associated protein